MYDHAHRKKKHLNMALLRNMRLLFVILVMYACEGGHSNTTASKSSGSTIGDKKEAKVDGKTVYNKHCMECHQENGEGIPNIYPTLKNAEWVGADKDHLIEILINGMTKQIVVNGIEYEDEMPKADYLTNKEIAAVLNYIRTHFAGINAPITDVDVARTRIRLKSKK